MPTAVQDTVVWGVARQTQLRVVPRLTEPYVITVLKIAAAAAAAPLVIAIYAFVAYPLILWIAARLIPKRKSVGPAGAWPSVTITVPVYNAEANIRATLERLLELDYPRDQLQLLVISDASSDRTDAIVGEFAGAGVELFRLPDRMGKTTAENRALAVARGDIIVNADATVLLAPNALKALVRVFDDPTIGVSSGRDRSVGDVDNAGTRPESGYVGYEMWIRDLETRVGSIVGASGCFYAIRRGIHANPLRWLPDSRATVLSVCPQPCAWCHEPRGWARSSNER
jgi:cellulose synthase/poly-beta-1,6-N-acetylglucosamine synthase-like glycosyltransferase